MVIYARNNFDATPKKMKQIEVAMLGVHAAATQLDHIAAKSFVRRQIKFTLAIITEICRRQLTSLQAIGADNFARRDFFDDQVIAKFVEPIDIEPSHVRFGQSFAERSDEHTSELQSHHDLVCRLLLE